jgi:AraC family transcriptional regulator
VQVPTIKQYQARLQRVLRYIDERLHEDIDVDVLSRVAAFSKFHFHRQFAGALGIGVSRYVQLTRLKRATYQLAFRDGQSIIEIALDSGYESPEAFSRAFKQRLGQTPSEFRNRPAWSTWHTIYRPIGKIRNGYMKQDFDVDQVKLVEVQETPVAVLEHRGDPALVGDTVRRFIRWRKAAGLPPKTNATFNILYDDPTNTPPADFRLDLCVGIGREIAADGSGIVIKTIPGGSCAVLRHIGSEDSFGDAISHLYGVWLPRSGREPRDFPLYCQRVTFFPDVPEHEAITDIYLPLK